MVQRLYFDRFYLFIFFMNVECHFVYIVPLKKKYNIIVIFLKMYLCPRLCPTFGKKRKEI